MKTLLYTMIATLLVSTTASAFNNGPYKRFRYSTDVSCSKLKSLINKYGALVVWESANPAIYELRVNNSSNCPGGQHTVRDSVPTADGRCRVKRCEDYSNR